MTSPRRIARNHRPARRWLALIALSVMTAAIMAPSPASGATAKPAWKIRVWSEASNFIAGSTGAFYDSPRYEVSIVNVGGATATGPIVLTDTLPPGITLVDSPSTFGWDCSASSGQMLSCTHEEDLYPGGSLFREFGVAVDPSVGASVTNEATVSSPGANSVTGSTTTPISPANAPFDFIDGSAGLSAALNEIDGGPASAAGSHPYGLTVSLGWQSRATGSHNLGQLNIYPSEGGLRDSRTYLPKGLIFNPQATPVLCTEAQFETLDCPDAATVGRSNIFLSAAGFSGESNDPVYNMVPPAGAASSFGFDPVTTGLHIHVLGGLRAGDYALAGAVNDVPSLYNQAVFAAQLQFWGDPSSPAHDFSRGNCVYGSTCPVDQQDTPFISMPTSCQPSIELEEAMDSWEHPGDFVFRSTPIVDLDGNPTGVTDCDAAALREGFKPTLKARPTTNVADAPSGLSVDLHIPQTNSLGELATAHLRRAVVTLPEGLTVNPSGANGLESCSSAQVGIDPSTGVANGAAPTCSGASRVGTAEVSTPLLDHPIAGSVFVATPHDNPFDSLLALYLVLEDPKTGVLVKLAGEIEPNPVTGRLVTTFDENPQVPFTHFKLDFFGGAGAPLRTPATCATYSTTSQMTPWSAPESGPPATPSDTYAITKAPNGGTCATSASGLPNSPSFDAGSASLLAGHYTPFVLNLKREDGTQEFSSIETTLPPGLIGKIAGTPYCSEAALARAATKTGREEKAQASCPSASHVGTVAVGAGAGPAPYYTSGDVYLAGPYKGGPLSLAIITPATAGPYDLGNVVVRTALKVDPETTRITAVSDPIPQILQGIPLDVRSIQLKLDKPEFTLNPTSCDPFAIVGQLVSNQGQPAALQNRFQVAECARLRFKPRLSIRLKGGTHRADHPALTAVLSYPKGTYANIAKASVSLPHSEFLDQSHIGTICTRVQFAADACPKRSIYGSATAVTPLLDNPLKGNVYLRSSNNALPDLVADLNGQIRVVLVGQIDSVRGGIRTRFESVPDAPVSKFVLRMQGGKKGLLVNSTNLCRSHNKAVALFDAQNGKVAELRPELRNSCKKKGKKHSKQKHRG